MVRSTQWMEFALNPGAVTQSDDQVRVEDWLVQPIAVDEVARVLVEASSGSVVIDRSPALNGYICLT